MAVAPATMLVPAMVLHEALPLVDGPVLLLAARTASTPCRLLDSRKRPVRSRPVIGCGSRAY